jgi:hypothetical protein
VAAPSSSSVRVGVPRVFALPDADPGFRLWVAWVQDLYDEDRDAARAMLASFLGPVLAAARAARS